MGRYFILSSQYSYALWVISIMQKHQAITNCNALHPCDTTTRTAACQRGGGHYSPRFSPPPCWPPRCGGQRPGSGPQGWAPIPSPAGQGASSVAVSSPMRLLHGWGWYQKLTKFTLPKTLQIWQKLNHPYKALQCSDIQQWGLQSFLPSFYLHKGSCKS